VRVNTESEDAAIRSCLAGESAAFEPLVRGNERRALAIAEAMLGDADEARDAVQESFVRAYRSLPGLERGRPFAPWFATILRNHCRDLLRAPRRRLRRSWEAGAVDGVAWSEPDAPARLAGEARSGVVRQALAALPVQHREVLVMKEIEGMSYAEIAAALGIAPGTVASRLHGARRAARAELERRGLAAESAS
jgi:RNA polymerase sigma factor (sigma-70 family)